MSHACDYQLSADFLNVCCLVTAIAVSGLQAAFLNQDHFVSVRRLKTHIMRETKDFLTALKLPFDEKVAKISILESWANGTHVHAMHTY